MFSNIFGSITETTIIENNTSESEPLSDGRIEGKVKWFNNEKGFGFIYTNELDDHFFNVKNVDGCNLPQIGDLVEFESNSGKKGLFATKIIIRSSKKDEGKVSCPNCQKDVIPRIIKHGKKSLGSVAGYGSWRPAYVSGNCPLCGYEIWKN